MLDLTAAYGGYDFNIVAVCQRVICMAAARHDFAVAFECNALASEFQHLDQRRATQGPRKLARLAVDGN